MLTSLLIKLHAFISINAVAFSFYSFCFLYVVYQYYPDSLITRTRPWGEFVESTEHHAVTAITVPPLNDDHKEGSMKIRMLHEVYKREAGGAVSEVQVTWSR